MAIWKTDLVVSEEYILENNVVKIFEDDKFIGFYGIKMIEKNTAEIDHLWLLPEYIKKGFGRVIFNHIIEYLKSKSINIIKQLWWPNKIQKVFMTKWVAKSSGNFKVR